MLSIGHIFSVARAPRTPEKPGLVVRGDAPGVRDAQVGTEGASQPGRPAWIEWAAFLRHAPGVLLCCPAERLGGPGTTERHSPHRCGVRNRRHVPTGTGSPTASRATWP